MQNVQHEIERIGSMPISKSAEIVFSIAQYGDGYHANIRKFATTQRYTGATKSGIVLKHQALIQLIELLEAFLQEVPEFSKGEIGRIPKSQSSEIVVQIIKDKRDDFYSLDIREYISSSSYEGWTKKGIRIRIEQIQALVELMKQGEARLRALTGDEMPMFAVASTDRRSQSRIAPETSESGAHTSIVDDVINAVIPEGSKNFPDDFLDDSLDASAFKEVELPPDRLRLVSTTSRTQQLVSDSGFSYEARNPVEAKYILYIQLQGGTIARIPLKPFEVFKAVKSYEQYLRSLQQQLVDAYAQRTHHRQTALHFAQIAFQNLGLPLDFDS